jgi:hypothetical protein
MIIEGESTNEDLTANNDVQSDANAAPDTGSDPASGGGADVQTHEPTEQEREQSDVDAFTKGVDSLKDPTIKAPGDAPTKKEKVDSAAAKPADAGKQPGDGKAGADPAAKDPKAKPADPALEAEISGLGLKGKSAERFREMAGEIKATRPMMETLASLNVKDQAQLNAILKDASDGLQWERLVMDSGAKQEQLTSALQIIKAMNADDPKLKGMALDAMLGECKAVAEMLGREIPGLTGDPLDKHPDLKQAVEALDITREHALELVKARTMQGQYDARDNAQRQAAMQRENQTKAEQAEVARVDQLSERLKASDPYFAAKLQTMISNGTMDRVKALPWNQRYSALEIAYNLIPNPVAATTAATQPGRVRPGPIVNRGNNVSGNGVARKEFKNDIEAFEFGVASVSSQH